MVRESERASERERQRAKRGGKGESHICVRVFWGGVRARVKIWGLEFKNKDFYMVQSWLCECIGSAVIYTP